MDPRRGTAWTYEDFDPVVEWKVGKHDQDIVEITLEGFRKEHVRVQVDNERVLRATGERPARGGKWVRFTKDLRLPDNCDADGVRARFEDEKLIITLPIVSPPDGKSRPATSPVHETPPSSPPRPSPSPPPPGPEQEQDTNVKPKPSVSPGPKPSSPRKEAPATVPETEMWETEIGISLPSPPPPPPHPPIEQEETKKEDSKVQEMVDKKEDDMELPTVIEPPMVATPKTMRELLVNMAAAAVVLVGIALSVWHSMRSKQ